MGTGRRKYRVLVADDDTSTCRTMEMIIRAKGFDVVCAHTGKKALELFISNEIDLVILDIKFPDKDGLELLEEFQRYNSNVDVIMITGYASVESVVHALNLGATAYITKPLNMEEVLRTISIAIEKKKIQEVKLRTEIALAQSEAKYRKLVENSTHAFLVFSLAPYRIVFANKATESLLGYSPDELLDMSSEDVQNIFHTDDQKLAIERIKRVIVEKEVPDKGYNTRLLTKEGRTVHVLETPSFIIYDDEPAYQSLMVDITNRVRAEEELQDRESKFRAVFEQAAVGMARTTVDGRIIEANSTLEETLGFDSGELEGVEVSEITPADDWEHEQRLARELLRGTRDSYQLTKRVYRKDGSILWGRLTVSASRDEQGQIDFIVGVLEDITEQKELEERLLFDSAILKNVNDAVIAVDMEQIIISWNQEAENVYGWSAEEALGEKIEDLLLTDFVGCSRKTVYEQVLDNSTWRGKVVQSKKDGTRLQIRSSLSLISDKSGEPIGLVGVNRDISYEVESQREIMKMSSLLKTLMENIPGVVYKCSNDENWTVQFISDHIEELVGYPKDAIINNRVISLEELIHPDDRASVRQEVEEALARRDYYNLQYRFVHREGDEIWVDDKGIGVFDEDDDLEYLEGVIIDSTLAREREVTIQKELQEKDLLLREIHHRVKNNLQIVSGILYLHSRSAKDPNVRQALQEGQSRIKLIALIHEVLYKSQAVSEINMKRYISDLVSIVYDTFGMSSDRIVPHFNIDPVKLKIEQAVPCGLIVNELLSNSFKYAFPDDRNGIVLFSMNQNDDLIELVVSDNGSGIPEHVELDSLNTLGLRMVKSLVENQLRGTLSIDGSDGTRITIQFQKGGVVH